MTVDLMELIVIHAIQDKSRARTLNVTFEGCSPVLLCLFIDNSRDEACRTSQIAFRAAMSDGSRRDLMSKNLDQVEILR